MAILCSFCKKIILIVVPFYLNEWTHFIVSNEFRSEAQCIHEHGGESKTQ